MPTDRPWYKKPWFISLCVLLLGVAFGLVASRLLADDQGDPSPAAGSSSAAGSSTATDGKVDGCLGGEDLTTALVTAQQEAPLTDEGLASLARTTLRWLLQYPVPSDAEATLTSLTGDANLAADILAEIQTKAQELQSSGYTSAEVDLSKGGYRLGSSPVRGDEGEFVEVEVLVYRTTDRAGKSAEQRMVIRPGFKIKNGKFVYGLQDPEPPKDRPDSEYTPYKAGC